jgi:hypothetical protein
MTIVDVTVEVIVAAAIMACHCPKKSSEQQGSQTVHSFCGIVASARCECTVGVVSSRAKRPGRFRLIRDRDTQRPEAIVSRSRTLHNLTPYDFLGIPWYR